MSQLVARSGDRKHPNTYELQINPTRNLGRIEVFNAQKTCIASRTVHNLDEVYTVLGDLQPLLELEDTEAHGVRSTFEKMGLS